CGLANASCAGQAASTVACIDDLYAADGTCAATLEPTFPHFIALPLPNDYGGQCFADNPVPCNTTPAIQQTRYTVDTFGNLLMPINWRGLLVTQGSPPLAHLMY